MAEKEDFYKTLGINNKASKDEIKSAYRKLDKKYHPDNTETGSEEKFKAVQEAYDILYDEDKRAAYDKFGHAAFDQTGQGAGAGNPFGGGFGGFGGFGGSHGFEENIDLGDIFSSFFGGGRSQRTRTGPSRGADVVMRLNVDFMDTITGKDVTIPYTYDAPCSSCNGSGAKSSSDVKTCPHCKGTGYVRVQKRSIFGVVESQEVCPECHGTGKIITNPCPSCNGKGYERKKVDLKIHIPAGINNGQQIRVTGKGERGVNGGQNGDLYIEIAVKKHSLFTRNGNDISIELSISATDAILGADKEVNTVYGKQILHIPNGTQVNTTLRMKGFGVKDLKTNKPGDQYVHLKIDIPTNLSKEQKALYEKLRELENKKSKKF